MGGSKGGRPRIVVTDEQRAKARELLGRTLHRSKVAASLMKEFEIGRPHAYAAIGKAIEDFKAELAGKGEVDALTLAYAGLTNIAGADDAKHRDRTAALSALVKLLGLKLVKDMGDGAETEDFVALILERRKARLSAAQPTPESKA